MQKVSAVELAFESQGREETIILVSLGEGEPCGVFHCSDIGFQAMVEAGLKTMRSRDGKLVEPAQATLSEWVNLLELEFGAVRVVRGQIPNRETSDPQDEASASGPNPEPSA